ncbi:MAG: hypothetical protein NVSMB18_09000 [Acetobacteraceae bacterium]
MNAPLAKEQIALLMSDSLTYRDAPVQGTDGTVAEPRVSLFSAVIGRIMGGLTALATMPRRRAVIDELSRLSDRELADIGLNRSELQLVFEPTFRRARNA